VPMVKNSLRLRDKAHFVWRLPTSQKLNNAHTIASTPIAVLRVGRKGSRAALHPPMLATTIIGRNTASRIAPIGAKLSLLILMSINTWLFRPYFPASCAFISR